MLVETQQVGEKGHFEYAESHVFRNQVVQFHFQLVRIQNAKELKRLETKYSNLLLTLKEMILVSPIEYKEYSLVLFKMIGYTRDIVEGKGEYELAYMMLHTWTNIMGYQTAYYVLHSFVMPEYDFAKQCYHSDQPYGSWKDIKYFCDYAVRHGWTIDHPLLRYAILLINGALHSDLLLYHQQHYTSLSLAAKWAPREKSRRFGWIAEKIAFVFSLENNHELSSRNKTYRKIVSTLNKALDTIQIKQCNKEWSKIDPKRITSISHQKQANAFLNVNKEQDNMFCKDRNLCASHYKTFIESSSQSVKGRHVELASFTKSALKLLAKKDHWIAKGTYHMQCALLHNQWKNHVYKTPALSHVIPLVDISMQNDPMYAAIALGCCMANRSSFERRMLVFGASCKWILFSETDTFIDMVEKISKEEWGMNTNFYAAHKMILETIIETNMVRPNITLVIFSDMQIDRRPSTLCFYEELKQQYKLAGFVMQNTSSLLPPPIVFWNLRSTGGYPCLSTEENVSMLSGYSTAMFDTWQRRKISRYHVSTCKKSDPWSHLCRELEKKRYNRLHISL